MTARLAIVGATGYTGRALLRHFAAIGAPWPVTALVRRQPEVRFPFVDYALGALPDRLPAGFPPRDTSVVIHLATQKTGRDLYPVNVAGTAALMDALPSGTAGMIVGSSMSVYGQNEQIGVTEDHPLRPDTALARSRVLVEELVTAGMRRRCATAYLLRPRFLTGRQDAEFLPGIRRLRALPLRVPAATVRLSMIDVDDYAAVLARLAGRILALDGRRSAVQQAFNVAYRRPIALERLFELAGSEGAGGRRWGPRPESVVSVCRRLPGTAAKRLRTRLELVTRSHWANVDRLEQAIGTDITGKDPEAVLASYHDDLVGDAR